MSDYEHGDWCVQVIRPTDGPDDRLSTFMHNFECHDDRTIVRAATPPAPRAESRLREAANALCEFVDDGLARGQSWTTETPDKFSALHQRLHDAIALRSPAATDDRDGLLREALERARLSLKGARGLALDHDEGALDSEFAEAIDIIDAALSPDERQPDELAEARATIEAMSGDAADLHDLMGEAAALRTALAHVLVRTHDSGCGVCDAARALLTADHELPSFGSPDERQPAGTNDVL